MESNETEATSEYAAARERGDFVIASDARALIHHIPPAREIVERTVARAERLLALRAE